MFDPSYAPHASTSLHLKSGQSSRVPPAGSIRQRDTNAHKLCMLTALHFTRLQLTRSRCQTSYKELTEKCEI